MTLKEKELTKYFGLEIRSIKRWKERGIYFTELKKLIDAYKTFGKQKKVFYEYFRKKNIEEGYIDRVWNIYINAQYQLIEERAEARKKQKQLKAYAEEIKQGRKI